MILDREEHRTILLELIAVAHFPGKAARVVLELTEAIEAATVEPRNEVEAFEAKRNARNGDGVAPTRA